MSRTRAGAETSRRREAAQHVGAKIVELGRQQRERSTPHTAAASPGRGQPDPPIGLAASAPQSLHLHCPRCPATFLEMTKLLAHRCEPEAA
jgi:hypothetical protein